MLNPTQPITAEEIHEITGLRNCPAGMFKLIESAVAFGEQRAERRWRAGEGARYEEALMGEAAGQAQ